MNPTPITRITTFNNNQIYIKREDLIPYSFGGNKARKAFNFFKEIDKGNFSYVVTYGSSSSNHCRVVANMAAMRKLKCIIISPSESSKPTYNSKMMDLFGAKTVTVPVNEVHEAIENTLNSLKENGENPYFIPGGGHGNLGTMAYIDCYKEIHNFENETETNFDYIFFASGTGTTQAGLVVGKLLFAGSENIIGISIARKNPRGKQIVSDSINEYIKSYNLNISDNKVSDSLIFDDSFTQNGYAKSNDDIKNTIANMLINHGIPLDSTYTAKAYLGMERYILNHGLTNKNILFIHTGGTPLFFDDLSNY